MIKSYIGYLLLPLSLLALDYSNIAGLSPIELINATSVAIEDFNGDGHNDLYFSCRFTGPSIIYINDGTGIFTPDPAWEANPGVYTRGVACGDYNNDGYPDLAIAELGGYVRLYNNDGTGFTDVTTSAGISSFDRNIAVFFIDYDNDGYLDLFIGRYLAPAKLYRNNGDGTFTDATTISGFGIVNDCLGVTAGDLNNDGWIDIVIATSSDRIFLLRNDDGIFTDVGLTSGLCGIREANGPHAGDFDHDGLIDLAFPSLRDGFRLFKNMGDMTFIDVSGDYGIDTTTYDNESALFIDGDGDTDLDLLFVSMGANRFYRNDGLTFTDATPPDANPLPPMGEHAGIAAGDLTGDHVPEIVVTGWTDSPHIILQRERGANKNWTAVRLEGSTSNRDAIGARVTAVISGIHFIQEVGMPLGRGSSRNAREVYFEYSLKIDTLFVRWPLGKIDTLISPLMNNVISINESTGLSIGEEPCKPDTPQIAVFPNPFNSTVNIISEGEAEIFNLSGRLVDRIKIPGMWIPSPEITSGQYFVRVRDSASGSVIYMK